MAEKKLKSKVMTRLTLGEAYMHCQECGSKLYSFDGFKDACRPCPYNKDGQCCPPDDRK